MILALDTETCRIRPGLGAPPIVCLSLARGDVCELWHRTEARERVVSALTGDEVIIGHNIAFDMAVFCAEWPDLVPLVFDVYEADRVTDVSLREQLQHIGTGTHHGFDRIDNQVVKLGYSLADITKRRLGIEMSKGADTWRLRYEELYHVPISSWPIEAQDYALFDAIVLPEIYKLQQEDPKYLIDEFRQARAAWWIELMEIWGIPINIEGVRAFAKKTHREFTSMMDELCAAGLAQKKRDGSYSRKEKFAREYMRKVCFAAGRQPEMTPPSKSHPHGQAKIDDDNCQRSGDPLLKKYGDASSLMKTLSTDVPLLLGVPRKKGVTDSSYEGHRQKMIQDLLHDRPVNVHRIWTHFDSLKNSGRTGSAPNVQNWPTMQGMRECVEAPPGQVFAIADYSGFELRTWSQCCLFLFGQSKMAEALNAGRDPHIEMACQILKMAYDEAHADYKQNPKGRVYNARQTSKVGNFGLPGGLREHSLVDYARKSYGVILTPYPETPGVMSAHELIQSWYDAWPEAHLWFERLAEMTDEDGPREIKQFVSDRIRGGVGFTDGANTLFQGLAADAAKAAGFLIARACYAKPESPLYGWRIFNFIHDEFLLTGPDDEWAHDAAVELARLMKLGAEPFLPDVPAEAEPLLARRMSKSAKPVFDARGRLKPWDFGVESDARVEAAE